MPSPSLLPARTTKGEVAPEETNILRDHPLPASLESPMSQPTYFITQQLGLITTRGVRDQMNNPAAYGAAIADNVGQRRLYFNSQQGYVRGRAHSFFLYRL